MDELRIGLTIFLLKEDQVASFQNKVIAQNHRAMPLAAPLKGVFLPFPSVGGTPDWVPAVGSLLDTPIGDNMRAQSPGGLLVVEQQRTFVISFGHAWQKLEDHWIERDFGLRVALNVIPKDEVVEIKSEQVFAKWHLASERAPRAASVEEFGIDFDRDLVAVVEGVPKSRPSLGSTVRGSTSLRLKLPIKELESILEISLLEFASTAYKKDWPDIDKINPVRDPIMIQLLDDQLNNILTDEKARNRIVMFTPSQRRGESIVADSYVYGRLSKSAASTPYLTIEGWINDLARHGAVPSISEAKNSKIHLLDDTGSEAKTCTTYDCLGYELSDGNQVYVLSSGIWYEVVSNFIDRINTRVANIAKPKLTLPAWNHKDREAEYNIACATDNKFLNCDAKNMHYGGGDSQFEFCDLFYLEERVLFFAKIVSKSSGMSHLTEQVRRTAQLFFGTDNGYRRELAGLFAKYHPTVDASWLNTRPRQGDWELCLVSLGKSSSDLPFFAKCGLAKVHKDLSEQGHALSFVDV